MKRIFTLALVSVLLVSCDPPTQDPAIVVDSAIQTLTAQPLVPQFTQSVEDLAKTAIAQTMVALTPAGSPTQSVEEIVGTSVAQTLTAQNGASQTQPPAFSPTSETSSSPISPGNPQIIISSVPAIGEIDSIYGRVEGVVPSDYVVAIYILVNSGWWTKPTFAQPTVPIDEYGEWSCFCFTGANDPDATVIRAYLIPAGYIPPAMSGGGNLPSKLEEVAVAMVIANRK